jgi:hypothetical protein
MLSCSETAGVRRRTPVAEETTQITYEGPAELTYFLVECLRDEGVSTDWSPPVDMASSEGCAWDVAPVHRKDMRHPALLGACPISTGCERITR